MDHNDLLIYKKTEVLLNEVYPVLKNFPRAEKFALCQEIKQAFYSLLKFGQHTEKFATNPNER